MPTRPRHAHKARHAAPYNSQAIRAAATASADYEPKHGAPVDLVSTTYTGHGLSHGTYRADVRMGSL